MKGKKSFTKEYARDFSLPLVEIWCRAETTNPRYWTKAKQPAVPYEVFSRADGLVTAWVDNLGVNWIKQELRRQIGSDENYIELVVSTFVESVRKMDDLYAAKSSLSRSQLTRFFTELEEAWAWHEANWFLMEVLDEDNDPRVVFPSEARKNLQHFVPEADVVIRRALRSLYPELGGLSAQLLVDEVLQNRLPTQAELEGRDLAYCFLQNQLYTGKGLDKLGKEWGLSFVVEGVEQVREFKGNVAFAGKAQGIVRKVLSRTDLKTVQKGEVLVTPMTMPEYVPAMKLAAAIVTDEGGITCHAAIVARELRKPCIIGTRIATQVLKDGEMVEVNALTGTVTIL